jgi:F-type H+-transporting ATPase subunit b
MNLVMLAEKLWPMALIQALAFLLFVWLLKRYASEPVLKILDERRQKIAKEFDQIASSEKRVAALREEYEEHLRKIDEEARKRTQEEIARGRRAAEEIVEAARAEGRDVVEKARVKLQLEVDQARIRLKEEIVGLVIEAAERLLREKMDDARHRQMVAAFVDDLERKN